MAVMAPAAGTRELSLQFCRGTAPAFSSFMRIEVGMSSMLVASLLNSSYHRQPEAVALPSRLPLCSAAKPSGVAGVTLIELMVAVSVMAVVLTIAAPSFEMVRNSSRLSAQANELVGALHLARSEAVSRRQWVGVCSTDDGAACSTASASWEGWLVFVDLDRNGERGSGEDRLRTGEVRAPLTVLAGSAIAGNLVTFRPDGLARAGDSLLNATITICIPTTSPNDNLRRLTIASGSRLTVTSANGNGECHLP